MLESFLPMVGRLNNLIEQFAAAHSGHENLTPGLRRTASQLKLKLTGVGLDSMAQLCGAIEIAAARGAPPQQKARILRENLGMLKHQLELAIRTVIREDAEMQAKKAQQSTE